MIATQSCATIARRHLNGFGKLHPKPKEKRNEIRRAWHLFLSLSHRNRYNRIACVCTRKTRRHVACCDCDGQAKQATKQTQVKWMVTLELEIRAYGDGKCAVDVDAK